MGSPLSSISLLNSCKNLRTLKQAHASIIVSKIPEHSSDGAAAASKLASLNVPVSALNGTEKPDTFNWNAAIKARRNSGLAESAVSVFKRMREKGVPCDGYTLPILSKCGGGPGFAGMIHCAGVRMGFQSDVYFCNAAIDGYARSGCFWSARKVFDEMPSRDLVSWTSVISGCAREGNASSAFALFEEMLEEEVAPNEVTLIVMLQACPNVPEVRELHGYSIKSGSITDQSLKNAVLKMYVEFGSSNDSETLFEEFDSRDSVSWNTMMRFYCSEGKASEIVVCLNEMRREVINPTVETFTLVVSGLAGCGAFDQNRQIHSLALKTGVIDDILTSCLLDLYSKSGCCKEAIELFKQMLAPGVKPDTETMRNLIVACPPVGALRLGKAVHGYFIRNYVSALDERSNSFETSVLNMYGKCGDIFSARNCFDRMPVKDLVAWSSMIEGYGTHGLGSEALKTFDQMKEEKISPNNVVFLSLLSACSHSGILNEGCKALHSMKSEFGIEPDLEHYTCVVDLLGRSGKTKEALSIILKRVFFPDSKIWSALLSAARVLEDRKIGAYAAEKVFELESDNAGYYTMFSNVHASGERWDEVREVRSVMREMNLVKFPGWSCLQVKGCVHGFVSRDRSHCRVDDIYAMVECLRRSIGSEMCVVDI